MKPKCSLCLGTGDAPYRITSGEDLPCPLCMGTGGWPRSPEIDLIVKSMDQRLGFMRWQRNLAIACAGLFAFWALFNWALFRRLLDEITKLH